MPVMSSVDVRPVDTQPSGGGFRAFIQGLVALGSVAVIILLAPFVVLLIGLPIALFLRMVIELIASASAFLG